MSTQHAPVTDSESVLSVCHTTPAAPGCERPERITARSDSAAATSPHSLSEADTKQTVTGMAALNTTKLKQVRGLDKNPALDVMLLSVS